MTETPARLRMLLNGVTATSAELVRAASSHALQIGAGAANILHPRTPTPPTPTQPPIERSEVYLISSVRWTEAGGEVKCAAAHTFAHLPVEAAEKALRWNLADVRGSRRTEQLIAAFGSSYAVGEPSRSYDLAAEDAAAAAPPPLVMATPFMAGRPMHSAA